MSDAAKSFIKAQAEMGKAIKNSVNPHLKNKYADLGAVMEAAFPALHANGFAVLQPCGCDEMGHYVETILLHETGDKFTSRIYLLIGKQDMQGIGSGISYARRYGLLGMAGLSPEDDDGEATKAAPRAAQRGTTSPDDASVTDAVALLHSAVDQAALTALWKSLPPEAGNAPAVIEAAKARKAHLTQIKEPA